LLLGFVVGVATPVLAGGVKVGFGSTAVGANVGVGVGVRVGPVVGVASDVGLGDAVGVAAVGEPFAGVAGVRVVAGAPVALAAEVLAEMGTALSIAILVWTIFSGCLAPRGSIPETDAVVPSGARSIFSRMNQFPLGTSWTSSDDPPPSSARSTLTVTDSGAIFLTAR
jgi:hypothetical protein